ncbi:MAG: amino acid ABC transporter substrate-binding protein [Chloroflexi bacterium]|nr:amino acid ABC transporter substrate-binding protein [Chloroflexota bacterium]
MSSHILISPKEKKSLTIFSLVFIFSLALIGLLGAAKDGFMNIQQQTDRAEIAVLAPLAKGEYGQGIVEVASIALANRLSNSNEFEGKKIVIRAYNSGTTPGSAATAAFWIAQNPNVVAIVGPLNARQVQAVAETVKDKKIPILIPASTAPIDLNDFPNVYRLLKTDDYEGPAMASFLESRKDKVIFVVGEPTFYVARLLDRFNPELGPFTVKGTGDFSKESAQIIVERMKDQDLDMVIYFGGPQKAIALLEEMGKNKLNIPILGPDTLYDTEFTSNYKGENAVYFVSPILYLQAIPDDMLDPIYKTVLDTNMDSPYAFETTQAVWFITNALANQQASKDWTLRQIVASQLTNNSLPGLEDQNQQLSGHSRTPTAMYVYKYDSSDQSLALVKIFQ